MIPAIAPLLSVQGIGKHFAPRGLFSRRRPVQAVDGVTLDILPGETVGLVGESGSGKSTLAQMIVRLTAPSAGTLRFEGRDLAALSSGASRDFAAQCQMVFQDPYSSLNPYRTIMDSLSRPFVAHRLGLSSSALRRRVLDLLAEVGLNPPERYADRYPHQLSGGERQRVAIGRAIALRPKLIVADEPVSSLDVSVRAQLLNLFKDLQERHGIAYLFITHDLATLRSVSHRVAVMYLGRLVEIGPTEEIVTAPSHPYTRALLSAVPIPDPARSRARAVITLEGGIPSPADPPSGCSFHPRCAHRLPSCAESDPGWLARGTRLVRCIESVVGQVAPASKAAASAETLAHDGAYAAE